jgi:Uma2 family endonuclease
MNDLLVESEISIDMPSRNHAVILSNICGIFYQYRQNYRLYSQLAINLNGWDSIPDFCVYPISPIKWDEDELILTTPPLLVIEILSPKQALKELTDKFKEYFKNGVQSCWLVNPTLEEIIVFDANGGKTFYHQGIIKDPVTQMEADLKNIFA